MKNLCTICARSGSKSLPNKNIKKLCGKPLISYTIEQAIDSNLFNFIVISTDSREIANIAEDFGINVWFMRPAEISTDSSSKLLAIKHALNQSEKKNQTVYDIITDLDVTSPLRSNDDLHSSYEYFLEKNFNNLISGCISRRNPYFNMVELENNKVKLSKNIKPIPNSRQGAPKVYDMNASIYIWKRETLLNNENLVTSNTGFFEMPENRSYDIDTILDWEIVENIMNKRIDINI